jgi:sulfonate dioxygenase
VTPSAEQPESVAAYEARTGTKAKDWLEERYSALGGAKPALDSGVGKKERGFKD